MRKNITFEKEFDFPSMINDITSISLNHSIKFNDNNSASGELIVSGTYKMTEASTIEEKFNYNIPVDISLIEKLDLDSAKISINDFKYELINDDVLKCIIEVLVEGIELIEDDEVEILKNDVLRECDGDSKEDKEIEVVDINEKEKFKKNDEVKDDNSLVEEKIDVKREEEKDDNSDNNSDNEIGSLFQIFDNSEETFTTYSVYIVRKDDNLESILNNYKITKEELEYYNDLNNIEIGTKLIIPTSND